mmetsp:Transcript_16185/g.11401  ORF Transcript_16185/g.11401 Transcript_16185/m.11401 type:complete len:126 (-) Transcript_16185:203-580(-)|eukprot:CAMPEP_0116875240 /NCGR_PEP_ID=MMETSP0463-20121206/7086_1 /TAXON_ID=181622 /ORGANISM="Strombidinopsis sp, Strain SopsisLIS2011" /LENGTH=125 /DNA_ID=CAMNT_0004520455 /DNA_START=963 /DNA_END=1340 /DNA_ORIENTATION=-
MNPGVIYLEHMSKETLDVAKSHTSYMNFKDNNIYSDIDKNPFNFNFIKPILSLKELAEYKGQPKVIVTSMASLSQGYARRLIREFASKPKNEIIFIEKSGMHHESIAAKLLKKQNRFILDDYTIN